jgi:hypothetical protein
LTGEELRAAGRRAAHLARGVVELRVPPELVAELRVHVIDLHGGRSLLVPARASRSDQAAAGRQPKRRLGSGAERSAVSRSGSSETPIRARNLGVNNDYSSARARPRRRDARHEMDALRRDRRRGARSKRRLRPSSRARRGARPRPRRTRRVDPASVPSVPLSSRLLLASRRVTFAASHPPHPPSPPSSSLAAAAAVPALRPLRDARRDVPPRRLRRPERQDRHRRHRRAAPRAQPMAPPAFVRGRRARPSRVPLRGRDRLAALRDVRTHGAAAARGRVVSGLRQLVLAAAASNGRGAVAAGFRRRRRDALRRDPPLRRVRRAQVAERLPHVREYRRRRRRIRHVEGGLGRE